MSVSAETPTRFSRRTLAGAAALVAPLALGAAIAPRARAGESTPGAGTPAAGTPAAGAEFGVPVDIYDDENTDVIATIAVDEIIDPFEEYDEFGAPESGSRYVAVGITVTNEIPNDSIDAPVYSMSLQTEEGGQYQPSYVYLPDDTEYPEFPTDAILGGESASGYIYFLLPEDAAVGAVIYASFNQYVRLIALTEAARPELGNAVTVADDERGEFASVAVTEYIDPFEDYAEFSAPDTNSRYVGVTLEIENLIANDGIDISGYDFSVVTAEGFLYSSTYLSLEDEDAYEVLESVRLRGGETGGGTVFFLVPEDAEITSILYRPAYNVSVDLGNPSA